MKTSAAGPRQKPRYRAQQMSDDMAAKGWMVRELARRAGLTGKTVTAFFEARVQTPKAGAALSKALGRSPAYYLIRGDE